MFWRSFQCFFAAFAEDFAVAQSARFSVINLVAVADVEAVTSAITPNRMLYEPRENLGKGRIEAARIDQICDRPKDIGAAA